MLCQRVGSRCRRRALPSLSAVARPPSPGTLTLTPPSRREVARRLRMRGCRRARPSRRGEASRRAPRAGGALADGERTAERRVERRVERTAERTVERTAHSYGLPRSCTSAEDRRRGPTRRWPSLRQRHLRLTGTGTRVVGHGFGLRSPPLLSCYGTTATWWNHTGRCQL